MKNLVLAFIFSASTILSGCAGIPGTTPGGGGSPDYAALIAQVQAYSRAACGFVPTAASILNMITGGNPGVVAATAISQAVCNAISPPMMAGRSAGVSKTVKGWHVTPGAVNGVKVEGTKG